MALPRVYERPMLFAIARDEHTIFISWNIDWLSVFDKAMPVDRQVHLRLIAGDGFEQEESRRADAWKFLRAGVATARDVSRRTRLLRAGSRLEICRDFRAVTMPADAPSENMQIDLATVPFHISFQKLVDRLGLTNGDPLVTALSRLEERIVAFAERDVDLAPADREILRGLDMSIEDLRSGRVSFAKRPNELRLRKRARSHSRLRWNESNRAAPAPVAGVSDQPSYSSPSRVILIPSGISVGRGASMRLWLLP